MQVPQVQTVKVFQNVKETIDIVNWKLSEVTHSIHLGFSFTGIITLQEQQQ